MKVSKEFKTGLVVVLAILLLIFGVNYLKGNSFFGGDDVYYAYFPSSGGLTPSANVTMSGVEVGKIMSVELVNPNGFNEVGKNVLVKFNIQKENLTPAIGSSLKIVPGLLDVSLEFTQKRVAAQGFHKTGDTLTGTVSDDMTETVMGELIPVKKKMEKLMGSVDNIVVSLNSFIDTSGAVLLDESLQEVKIAISRFGRVAYNLDNLISSERVKLAKIFSNVEEISSGLTNTTQEVNAVVGNFKTISNGLLSADLTGTIENAKTTLAEFNKLIEEVNTGDGTISKLLDDPALYNNLNKSNEEIQELLEDIKLHPERYINISLFGAKTKGAPLTKQEEKKLRTLLDSIPNN